MHGWRHSLTFLFEFGVVLYSSVAATWPKPRLWNLAVKAPESSDSESYLADGDGRTCIP